MLEVSTHILYDVLNRKLRSLHPSLRYQFLISRSVQCKRHNLKTLLL